MDPNIVTLIVGLAGIGATLVAGGRGLYFTARARSAPLRQLLYSKQIEMIPLSKGEHETILASV